MAKAEWGVKRACLACGARFYDMQKSPIVCPSCETVFDPEAIFRPRRNRPADAPAPANDDVVKKTKVVDDEDDDEVAALVSDVVVDDDDDDDDDVLAPDLDDDDDDDDAAVIPIPKPGVSDDS